MGFDTGTQRQALEKLEEENNLTFDLSLHLREQTRIDNYGGTSLSLVLPLSSSKPRRARVYSLTSFDLNSMGALPRIPHSHPA